MWSDVKRVYSDSAAFVIALPLVAAVPFAAEMVQHVVEVNAGMFDSLAGAEAAANDPARNAAGIVKVLTLFLMTYFVIRFIGFGRDRRQGLTVTRMSALLFGAVMLFSLAMMAVQWIGGTLLGQWITDQGQLLAAGTFSLFALMLLETYLAGWKSAAALGNPAMTVPVSARIMHPRLFRSFGFTIAMMMPLMIVHYALNFAAIGVPAGAMWAILIVDSAVAAFLGIVLAATIYRIASRAAEDAGVPLTGEAAAA